MPAAAPDPLHRLPKAELHLHLDGSLRPATVEEPARELGVVPADAPPGAAMDRVRVTRRGGLLEALAGFEVLLPLLQSKENLARVTRELVEDLAADGVVYAELRFCPRLNVERGLSVDEVLATVGEAAAEAPFARARAAGLAVTVHTGEAEPPAAIRTALDRYQTDRIGHATSLADDPELLAEVVERGVVVEACPRSNYWTRTPAQLPTLADHPVGRLLAAGVRVCLNTDDRTLFGNDLTSELVAVTEAQGLGDEQVAALAANGFAGAFHPSRAASALDRASNRLEGA